MYTQKYVKKMLFPRIPANFPRIFLILKTLQNSNKFPKIFFFHSTLPRFTFTTSAQAMLCRSMSCGVTACVRHCSFRRCFCLCCKLPAFAFAPSSSLALPFHLTRDLPLCHLLLIFCSLFHRASSCGVEERSSARMPP